MVCGANPADAGGLRAFCGSVGASVVGETVVGSMEAVVVERVDKAERTGQHPMQ